jgi:hypothetical protein
MNTNQGSVYWTKIFNNGGYNALSSYIMNACVCDFGPSVQPGKSPRLYKMSNLAYKATGILMWEPDDNQAGDFNDGCAIPEGSAASKRHITGCTLLRIGGSADFMRYSSLSNLMASKGPNDAWYGPGEPNTGGWSDGSGN